MEKETKKRKQSLKLAISFKENIRDLEIYNYILDQKDCLGTSTYLKLLVEKDMKQRGAWSLRD